LGIVTSSSAVTRPHPGPASDPVRPRLRGRLHQWAFYAAIVCGLVLCGVAASRPGLTPAVACAVYAATVCGLFGISALYHRKLWGPRGFAVMQRLDHSMIFIFIAGSYTPFCLMLLPPYRAAVLLVAVWTGAMLGVGLKVAFPGSPRWIGVPLYIALGWAALFVLPDILREGGLTTLVLLAVGGVTYSIGAVFYATQWPNPWPTTFGHHEFFHACTLIAATLHHIAVYFALFA
jgi:hemolysin III